MSLSRRTFLKGLGAAGTSAVFPLSAVASIAPAVPLPLAAIDAFVPSQPYLAPQFMYFFMKWKQSEPITEMGKDSFYSVSPMVDDKSPMMTMNLEIQKGVADVKDLGNVDFVDLLLDHAIPFSENFKVENVAAYPSGRLMSNIIFEINRAASHIARMTRRGAGNTILCSPDMAALLRAHDCHDATKIRPAYEIVETTREEFKNKLVVGYKSKTQFDGSIIKVHPKDNPEDYKFVVADTVPSYFRTISYTT